jgi:hypothetical protein
MKKTLKTFALFLSLFSICGVVLAQDLIPFEDENRKWGYKDNAGKVIIEPKFKNAKEFGTYEYAIADGTLIDKTGKTILTVNDIIEKNKLSSHIYLIAVAGNNEYWINNSAGMNSFGKYAKIDATGKVISEWRNGSVSTIGYKNESGQNYIDSERLLVCDYLFDVTNNSFDISYQIMHINGDIISEKYTYFQQECDGYVVSTEKWNTYDEKTGTKLSKKYSNTAKNYKRVACFDFSGKCIKVDKNFKLVKDLPNYIEEYAGPHIVFGMNIESNEVRSSSSSLVISSINCP